MSVVRDQLKALKDYKGELHFRVYNCVGKITYQLGCVSSKFCSWETVSNDKEAKPCDMCDTLAILFEYSVMYDVERFFVTDIQPKKIDVNLCAECSKDAIDKILDCINQTGGLFEYITVALSLKAKPKTRTFTSFQSMEIRRAKHDIVAVNKKNQQSIQNQFIDQAMKFGNGDTLHCEYDDAILKVSFI